MPPRVRPSVGRAPSRPCTRGVSAGPVRSGQLAQHHGASGRRCLPRTLAVTWRVLAGSAAGARRIHRASTGRIRARRDRGGSGQRRRYHRPPMDDEPSRRRPPRPVPLAPRAGADRHPRRRDLARGPRAGRRGDLDARRSTGSTTRRWSARWACRPATRSCAAPTSARPASPARRPQSPATLQAVLDEFTTRIAPHTLNSYHPRALSLLHAAAARRLDRRRGPRPVDEPGRRRLARGSRRRVRRGGGRALAVRPRRVRRGQLRAAARRAA